MERTTAGTKRPREESLPLESPPTRRRRLQDEEEDPAETSTSVSFEVESDESRLDPLDGTLSESTFCALAGTGSNEIDEEEDEQDEQEGLLTPPMVNSVSCSSSSGSSSSSSSSSGSGSSDAPPNADDTVVEVEVEGEAEFEKDEEFLEDIGRTQYRVPIDAFTMMREGASWPQEEYLFDRQVTLENRRELFVWMGEALAHFHCHSETHMLAFSIMHRCLSLIPELPLGRLQLAGLTVLFLALKYSEQPPYLREFVEALLPPQNRDISGDDVLEMEREILSAIDWDMNCPLPIHFLVSYWDSVEAPSGLTKKQVWHLSLYVIELMMGEDCLLNFSPSHVAASAFYVVRMVAEFCRPQPTALWTPELQTLTGKSSEQLQECVQKMLFLLEREAKFLQKQDNINISPPTLAYTKPRYGSISLVVARIILAYCARARRSTSTS